MSPEFPRNGRFIDITGKTYNQLTVIRFLGTTKGYSIWLCRCSCGKETSVRAGNLTNGRTLSCGCVQSERAAKANVARRYIPVGRMKEYRAWGNMMARCYDSSLPSFKDYGGRGIRVCPEWHEFLVFLDDMGPCPEGHSLDRRDNEGNYEPSNCRWATKIQQANNTRKNVFITAEGQTLTVSQWARAKGLDSETIYMRLKRGWSPERCVGPLLRSATRTAHSGR